MIVTRALLRSMARSKAAPEDDDEAKTPAVALEAEGRASEDDPGNDGWKTAAGCAEGIATAAACELLAAEGLGAGATVDASEAEG